MEPKDYLEQRTLDRLDAADPTAKDLADGIKLLYGRLWTRDDLVALIVQEHNELCSKCVHHPHEAINDTRWYQKLIWALAAARCTVIGWFCKQGNGN